MPDQRSTPSQYRPAALLVATVALSACLGACVRTTITTPTDTEYDRLDPSGEVAFFHNMASQPTITNDEAIHSLHLLNAAEDLTADYAARVASAKAAGWLSTSFDEPANFTAQRGMIAAAIARICRIQGGVMMRVLGPTPRYALRELVALRIMPDGSTDNQAISGGEFLATLGRARDYVIIETIKNPARDAQPEPKPEPKPEPQAEPAPEPVREPVADPTNEPGAEPMNPPLSSEPMPPVVPPQIPDAPPKAH